MLYRILDAAHAVVAELQVRGEASVRRKRVTIVVLAADVELRESAGRDMLLFRSGVGVGCTIPQAIEAGWAAVEPGRRGGRRRPVKLTEGQEGSLLRLFRDHVRRTSADE